MNRYNELIKSLRKCQRMTSIKDECIEFEDGACEGYPNCMIDLMDEAADSLEELLKFAYFVTWEVLAKDFEESPGFFAEVACRKLVKLGIVENKDGMYSCERGDDDG